MRKIITLIMIGWMVVTAPAWAQTAAAPATGDDASQMRNEIEQLKKSLAQLEGRLAAQEKKAETQKAEAAKSQPAPAAAEALQASVKELDHRVTRVERDTALDRVKITGDYRFETHSIWGNVPAHFDGMKFQNLLVKTMFSTGVLGHPPSSISEINNTVANNYAGYLYFTNNLTFNQLKQAVGQIPVPMQQQLFGMLQPSTYVPAYKNNNDILYTNRLRLNLESRINDQLSVTARLSMYKVFGDSTGVQVFDGQPNSLNMDGTTVGVPNSDQLRVERAYFTWNKIGGSPFFLSVGRRPSTGGPPLNYREDELRGGTPSGPLIDYQFDGLTFGYHVGEKAVFRLCYGLGYESGFGNGNLIKMPQDRLKDVHFLGGNLDLWTTDKTLVQVTIARAFNVTDGFNGQMVLPDNPLTGDPVGAPVVMRFTPSANLGNINLFGATVTRKLKSFDLFASANAVALRPNGVTTPFGGLGSDPFESPSNHHGQMIYVGARYSFRNDGRTKMGFEYNHGSKYWFNFAQAEDDIIAPKTNTRGDVYETYFTHRINNRFILKAGYIRYLYDYSGSGWHLGAPKKLDSTPVLGFPTYDRASMVSVGLTTRF